MEWLHSKSWWKRMFAVYGYYWVGNIILLALIELVHIIFNAATHH